MCNAMNHPYNCECGFGGDTGYGVINNTHETQAWDFDSLEQSLTYPTNCWWCGESVFFHRDEHGGCALFDALGPPWPLHSCWEEHHDQQRFALISIKSDLNKSGYDGRFYSSSGKIQTKPINEDLLPTIQGYIANNHFWYNDPEKIYIRATTGSASAPLVKLDVADSKNRIFTFLVPDETAKQIDDYSIVSSKGCWLKKGRRWVLFATKIVVQSLKSKDVIFKVLNLEKKCRFCAKSIDDTNHWGLDTAYQIECDICGKMRGKMLTVEFIEYCKKIACNLR